MAGNGDPMALAESFLGLMMENAVRLTRIGLPAYSMIQKLRDAIDAYRRAEQTGDLSGMKAAETDVDLWLRRHLQTVVLAVTTPSPWEGAG